MADEEFSNLPFAEWLEDTIKNLVESNPKHICVTAILPDETVGTAYWMCDARDKAILAHNIQADVTLDIIEANIGEIKRMLEEAEEREP